MSHGANRLDTRMPGLFCGTSFRTRGFTPWVVFWISEVNWSERATTWQGERHLILSFGCLPLLTRVVARACRRDWSPPPPMRQCSLLPLQRSFPTPQSPAARAEWSAAGRQRLLARMAWWSEFRTFPSCFRGRSFRSTEFRKSV